MTCRPAQSHCWIRQTLLRIALDPIAAGIESCSNNFIYPYFDVFLIFVSLSVIFRLTKLIFMLFIILVFTILFILSYANFSYVSGFRVKKIWIIEKERLWFSYEDIITPPRILLPIANTEGWNEIEQHFRIITNIYFFLIRTFRSRLSNHSSWTLDFFPVRVYQYIMILSSSSSKIAAHKSSRSKKWDRVVGHAVGTKVLSLDTIRDFLRSLPYT